MTGPDELSFLPDGYNGRRLRQRTIVSGTIAMLVVAVACVCAVVFANRSLQQAEREHAAVEMNYNAATQNIAMIMRQRDEQRAILHSATLAAALTDGVPRSNIIAELTNALPAKTSLIELRIEPKSGVASSGGSVFDIKRAALESKNRDDSFENLDLPPQQSVVRLSALADTDAQVSQYLSRLTRSPLFRDVKLLISEAQPAPGKNEAMVRKFQVQLTVNANARRKIAPQNTTAGMDLKADQ